MSNLEKIQRLTLIMELPQYRGDKLGLYKCECGTEKVYRVTDVKNKIKTACGCQRFGEANKGGFKHGLRSHPLYYCWKNFISRCYNSENVDYKNYGGRGITVCAEWHDLSVFILWAESNGYEKGLQLDRKENDGNYEPINCRFVTPKVNNNNRRNNRLIEFNGKRQTVQQWADEIGISSGALRRRIDFHKIPLERAMLKNANKYAIGS